MVWYSFFKKEWLFCAECYRAPQTQYVSVFPKQLLNEYGSDSLKFIQILHEPFKYFPASDDANSMYLFIEYIINLCRELC